MNNQTVPIEIYTQRPCKFTPHLEVSSAYLRINSKTLFLQRSGSERGFWGVPAGKVEKGESPREAVVRELSEETGISLPKTDTIKEEGKLYMIKPHISYIYHVFTLELPILPSISLSPEHLDFGWFLPDEIKKLPLMAGALEAYEFCYFRSRKKSI